MKDQDIRDVFELLKLPTIGPANPYMVPDRPPGHRSFVFIATESVTQPEPVSHAQLERDT